MGYIIPKLIVIIAIICHLIYIMYEEQRNNNSISFKHDQTEKIMRYHIQKIKQIQNIKNKKISFGLNSNIDIAINGFDLMKQLKMIVPKPKLYKKLDSIQALSQTFAFYVQQGSSTELRMTNQTTFDFVVDQSKQIQNEIDLGGNAPMMALRAYLEDCEILLGSEISEEYFDLLFNKKIQISQQLREIEDIHLVLDYYYDENWGKMVPPKSNRFYLNMDKNIQKLSSMDNYFKKEKEFKSEIFVLGGLQLLDQNELKIKDLFQRLKDYTIQTQQWSKLHVEMGNFANENVFLEFMNNIFKISDSAGFNELEIANLVMYLQNGDTKQTQGQQINFKQILNLVLQFIEIINKQNLPLSRFHLHALNLQIICNNDKWLSPKLALSKSILAMHQTLQVKLNKDIDAKKYDFDIKKCYLDYPKFLKLPQINNEFVYKEFDIENPIDCWDVGHFYFIKDNIFQCCISPGPYIKHPQRTRGLGDNISSTGLVYHKINN